MTAKTIDAAVEQTLRQQLFDLLCRETMTVRELSQAAGIPEKAVAEHLMHIGRSVARCRQRLVIVPSQCLDCGFIFTDRSRFTKPSRCPQCRHSRLTAPGYRVV